MKLATELHLDYRLRMCGAIPLLPDVYISGESWSGCQVVTSFLMFTLSQNSWDILLTFHMLGNGS